MVRCWELCSMVRCDVLCRDCLWEEEWWGWRELRGARRSGGSRRKDVLSRGFDTLAWAFELAG